MIGWQWHQLDHMQIICTSLQTDNYASTSPLSFTGRMPFLPPNQQRQSTEDTLILLVLLLFLLLLLLLWIFVKCSMAQGPQVHCPGNITVYCLQLIIKSAKQYLQLHPKSLHREIS